MTARRIVCAVIASIAAALAVAAELPTGTHSLAPAAFTTRIHAEGSQR